MHSQSEQRKMVKRLEKWHITQHSDEKQVRKLGDWVNTETLIGIIKLDKHLKVNI